MSDLTDAMLAKSRAYCTREERLVVALEAIADQLGSLVTLVMPAGVSRDVGDSNSAEVPEAAGEEDAWENEGGSVGNGSAPGLGIKHSLVDQFEINGYRYTKLADAIAQAKRTKAP